jgi:hypothetical protein
MNGGTRKMEVPVSPTKDVTDYADAMSAASSAWAACCQQALASVLNQVSAGLGVWEFLRHKEEADGIFLAMKINGKPDPSIEMERTVNFSSREVSHDALLISPEGKGYGKRLLRNCIEIYRGCGIRKVTVYAGLELGPYVWGRIGFIPTQASWDSLRQTIRSNLDEIHNLVPNNRFTEICEDLDDSDPYTLWTIVDDQFELGPSERLAKKLLKNASWNGYLDLENKAQLDRLSRYLGDLR